MSATESACSAPSDVERVLGELPQDGTPILTALAVERAATAILGRRETHWLEQRRARDRAWAALLLLCTERRASAQTEQGHSYAARVT